MIESVGECINLKCHCDALLCAASLPTKRAGLVLQRGFVGPEQVVW